MRTKHPSQDHQFQIFHDAGAVFDRGVNVSLGIPADQLALQRKACLGQAFLVTVAP
jgi:hypothetical protein